MKKFIVKTAVFAVIVLIAIFGILTYFDRQGYSDSYYKRVITKGCPSLVIGTSLAAQGIVPEIINTEFRDSGYDLPISNFAFALGISSYDRQYFKAIRGKVSGAGTDNGIFILSVEPFSLGNGERQNHLNHVIPIFKPNYRYMLRYFRPYKWYRKNENESLHDDGWLEIKNIPMDSTSVEERIHRKMADYHQWDYKKSMTKINCLADIIKFLKPKGNVILCRIPVSSQMKSFADSLWPGFNSDMEEMCDSLGVTFIHFDDVDKYRTTDGNHLYSEDARVFTKDLCDSIKSRYGI